MKRQNFEDWQNRNKPQPQSGQNFNQNKGGYGGGSGGGNYSGNSGSLPKHLKLDSFYDVAPDGTKAISRRVFMDVGQGIADEFMKTGLTASSIRRYFEAVRTAFERYSQNHNHQQAMEKLYRLVPAAHKSEDRKVTNGCFTDFMRHYVDLASKDPDNIKGFKELFMSVIGYTKK